MKNVYPYTYNSLNSVFTTHRTSIGQKSVAGRANNMKTAWLCFFQRTLVEWFQTDRAIMLTLQYNVNIAVFRFSAIHVAKLHIVSRLFGSIQLAMMHIAQTLALSCICKRQCCSCNRCTKKNHMNRMCQRIPCKAAHLVVTLSPQIRHSMTKLAGKLRGWKSGTTELLSYHNFAKTTMSLQICISLIQLDKKNKQRRRASFVLSRL